MTAISASQVKELRDRTGAGMMDCKNALAETDGDIEKAVELLRVRLGDKALKVGGREARIFEEQAADKPENIRPKIVEGQLRKWYEEVVLLNQPHVNTDKYDGKTIEQLRVELSGTTGENVVIRRFARFQVGS